MKKISISNIIMGLNILLIVCTGLIRTQFLLDAFFVALIPICMSNYALWKDRGSRDISIKSIKVNKKIFFISFILTVIFLIMLSLEQVAKVLLQMDNEIGHLLFKIMFLPMIFVDVFICLYFILNRALNNSTTVWECNDSQKIVSDEFKFLKIYKPVWIIIWVAVYFFIAYFPGDPCSDVPASIIEKGHVFSDWHTIGWELFMRIFVFFTRNWTCLVIAQGVFLVLAHNYVVDFLYKRIRSQRVCYLYAILNVTLGIMQFRFMVNMTKDINFLFSMMFFVVTIMVLIKKDTRNNKDFIVLCITGVFASFFRHMSIEIVIATGVVLIIVLLFEKQKVYVLKSLIVLASIVLIHTVIVNGIGFSLLKGEKNPEYVKYSIPMNVAAAMAYRNQTAGEYIPDNIVKDMEKIMPIEKWSDCYCSYDADVVSRTWNRVGDDILKLNDKDMQKNLINLNWYFLTHNTKAYIISFFDINSIVWEMATPADEELYYVVSEDRTDILHLHKGASFYTIEDTVEYISKRPILTALFLRGGIATFMIVLAFVIFMIKRSKLVVGMIPIILYDASLFISIPQVNCRYSMPIIVFAILFMIIAMCESKENAAK